MSEEIEKEYISCWDMISNPEARLCTSCLERDLDYCIVHKGKLRNDWIRPNENFLFHGVMAYYMEDCDIEGVDDLLNSWNNRCELLMIESPFWCDLLVWHHWITWNKTEEIFQELSLWTVRGNYDFPEPFEFDLGDGSLFIKSRDIALLALAILERSIGDCKKETELLHCKLLQNGLLGGIAKNEKLHLEQEDLKK